VTNPNYGYDDGMLVSVINATNTGIGQMRNLNSSVMSLAGALPSVNNSTSGVKLAGLLNDWNQNYSKIIAELEQLNGKASGLLQSNRNVETETSSAPK
jgi:hypothetical protein